MGELYLLEALELEEEFGVIISLLEEFVDAEAADGGLEEVALLPASVTTCNGALGGEVNIESLLELPPLMLEAAREEKFD